MTLPYGEDERICAAVSVRQYRRYTEIMEQNVTESIEDAVEANARILSEIFGVPMTQIRKMDAEDVMTAAKQVHFVMQDVITQKFLDLNPEHPEAVEKEASAFDEYDEENGYNDDGAQEERNFWQICRENVDRVVKLCIRLMKNSYQDCMEADIMSLLDYVAFSCRPNTVLRLHRRSCPDPHRTAFGRRSQN